MLFAGAAPRVPHQAARAAVDTPQQRLQPSPPGISVYVSLMEAHEAIAAPRNDPQEAPAPPPRWRCPARQYLQLTSSFPRPSPAAWPVCMPSTTAFSRHCCRRGQGVLALPSLASPALICAVSRGKAPSPLHCCGITWIRCLSSALTQLYVPSNSIQASRPLPPLPLRPPPPLLQRQHMHHAGARAQVAAGQRQLVALVEAIHPQLPAGVQPQLRTR